MYWTDEKRAELSAYWAAGMVAAEIGLRLGCSTNAVRTERLRMGLPKRQERGVIGQCGCAKWRSVAAQRDELLAALEEWALPYEGWDQTQLRIRYRPELISRINRTRAAIARAKGKHP